MMNDRQVKLTAISFPKRETKQTDCIPAKTRKVNSFFFIYFFFLKNNSATAKTQRRKQGNMKYSK